jgi:hypothetical protein
MKALVKNTGEIFDIENRYLFSPRIPTCTYYIQKERNYFWMGLSRL